MADQATGAVDTAGAASLSSAHAGGVQHLEHNSGRPISWVGVLVAIIGSVVGGAAFIPHMNWPLLWAGCAVFLVGLFVLVGAKTFSKDWY